MTTATDKAEELVIGACLLEPDSIQFAAEVLDHSDFYSVMYGDIFRAILQLRKDGEVIEPHSVWTKTQEMGVLGVELPRLLEWTFAVGTSASIRYYADQVLEAANRRRFQTIAMKLMQEARDERINPSQAAQNALASLKSLGARGDRRMQTKTLEEILSVEEDHDWLIPGLLERGDRLILTGFEGGGKTTWVRQMVLCMAAGIHPTTLDRLEKPLTVLVVDAENTEAQWRHHTRGMVHNIWRMGGNNPAPNIHIHAKGRIDITRDATLGEIHRLVDEHEPHVLAIGPIYKMVSTGINNDQEAAPVITALDSLRDRGLALIMEGHSPKGTGANGQRDMSPRGSAAMLGWPEFGFGMVPDPEKPGVTNIQRWRGDRDTGREWPRELYRGGLLPWMGDTVSRGGRNTVNNMQATDHYAAYN